MELVAGLGVGAGRDLTHNSNGGGVVVEGGTSKLPITNNTNKRNTIYTDSETGTGITFRYKAKSFI